MPYWSLVILCMALKFLFVAEAVCSGHGIVIYPHARPYSGHGRSPRMLLSALEVEIFSLESRRLIVESISVFTKGRWDFFLPKHRPGENLLIYGSEDFCRGLMDRLLQDFKDAEDAQKGLRYRMDLLRAWAPSASMTKKLCKNPVPPKKRRATIERAFSDYMGSLATKDPTPQGPVVEGVGFEPT